MGEDADTTGAVYGQLAGAFYGDRGIPRSWRYKLAHQLLIEYFAERLYHLGITVDWDRILAFLPIFERPGFVFARERTSPGYAMSNPETGFRTEIPYYEWAPEVREFHQALYDAGVIYPFDWGEWHREAERLVNDRAALASVDEVSLRKLLTFHARKERCAEGHFIEMLKSWHVTAILRRLKGIKQARTTTLLC